MFNEKEFEIVKERALENHVPIIMDDTLEVVLYDDGPSGDPHYTVYSKKGNNLESLYDN